MSKRPDILRTLPCELTPAEIDERAKKLAQTVSEITSLDHKAKEIAGHHKRERSLMEGAQQLLARQVSSGIEDRPISCRWLADHESRLWTLIRIDTGELLDREDMSDQDRQQHLFDG